MPLLEKAYASYDLDQIEPATMSKVTPESDEGIKMDEHPVDNENSTENDKYKESDKSTEKNDDQNEDISANKSESKYNFLQRLKRRPVILVCVYCGIIGYNVFGIVFDWLWAVDMVTVEKGLVFGPASDAIVAMLFIIAIVGTASFFFEITNFTKKIYKDESILDEDVAQVITLFVDEVPSITLSLLLAACREVPISYYQLAKAALSMLGAAFRTFRALFRFLRPAKHKWKGALPWVLRVIIFAACVYNVVAACFVWIYTFIPEDGSGFRLPDNIVENSYDNGRYFYKSGVYFSHPVFHQCNHGYNTYTWNETRINWIQLDAIYTIIEDEGVVRSAEFYFNAKENVIVWQDLKGVTQCFITDTTDPVNCVTSQQTGCSPDMTQYDRITFTFSPAKKDKALLFGDIKVNASLTHGNGSNCEYLTIDDWGFFKTQDSSIIAQLQYLQADMTLNDSQLVYPYFIPNATSGLRYYQYYEDAGEMNNVTDVWLTGYHKCEMTGALAPNPDVDLQPMCGVGAYFESHDIQSEVVDWYKDIHDNN